MPNIEGVSETSNKRHRMYPNGTVSEQVVRNIPLTGSALEASLGNGGRWKPLTHGHVLDEIENALTNAGLTFAASNRRFTIAADGQQMFATIPLDIAIIDASAAGRSDSVSLMLGIANSTDKSRALKLGFGSRVLVCSNGAFYAEEVVGRKHTTNIIEDLPGKIATLISAFEGYVQLQRDFFGRLREIAIDLPSVHDFVVESAKRGAITKGEILDIVEEFENPSHAEFSDRNAWSLHNAFTECSKRIESRNGNQHAERMVLMTDLFRSRFAADLASRVALNN
ncbi:MAG: DUF945 domain-containing protein [Candidatus Competibacteraceae bacterium]|nr:DUF945 domain-containing protein [Candidatus Competibacteraceae bacterium]